MRIRFKKGLTPEAICEYLSVLLDNEELVIGTVNVYVQEYDDDMQVKKFSRADEPMVEVVPGHRAMAEYQEYVAQARRRRMKIV